MARGLYFGLLSFLSYEFKKEIYHGVSSGGVIPKFFELRLKWLRHETSTRQVHSLNIPPSHT